MSENKKSIIKEALGDYEALMEAATNRAKSELATEFPEQFNKILKESLISNKGNMKKTTGARKTVSENFDSVNSLPSNNNPIDEIVAVIDDANSGEGSGIVPTDNNKNDDDVITVDDIAAELDRIDGENNDTKDNSTEDNSTEDMTNNNPTDNTFGKLTEIQNQLTEIMNKVGKGEDFNFNDDDIPSASGYNEKDVLDDPNSREYIQPNGEPDFSNYDDLDEDDYSIEDLSNELPDEEPVDDQIDERHGVDYASNRSVSNTIPGKEYKGYADGRQRLALQESDKESKTKISSLVKENMSLTKKLNEAKKYKGTVGDLLENYKTALGKYRNQLKEMAVFNTNLAHVNNLLVNEELSLTQDDKVNIINEFKNVNSIAGSTSVYKKLITEMKGSKKTITESIEDKLNTSIQTSSKQKLDEVVEKTAYSDNKHIQDMKRVINYVEGRGKK